MLRTNLWNFVRLTRPIFLLGGALMYVIGILIAASQGIRIDWGRAVLGQWMVTIIQVTAHYSNEYHDAEVDRLISRNRTLFSGGSGVLPGGGLPAEVALTAARICAFIAIFTVAAAFVVEPVAGVVGAIALIGGWFYASPPLSLMSTGWGELTTSIIVALLTPLTGYALQSGRIDAALFSASLPLALIHGSMMISFEFPDYEADMAAGKKTLAVRLGRDRAALVHNVLIAAAVLVVLWSALQARPWLPAKFLWLALPLAAWQCVSIALYARRAWQHNHLLTFGAIALFGLTALLWLAGIVVR